MQEALQTVTQEKADMDAKRQETGQLLEQSQQKLTLMTADSTKLRSELTEALQAAANSDGQVRLTSYRSSAWMRQGEGGQTLEM